MPQVGMRYELTDAGLAEGYPPDIGTFTITNIGNNYIYFNDGTYYDDDLFVPKNLFRSFFRPI